MIECKRAPLCGVVLGLLLAGCSAPGANPSLNSIRQPVVERTSHMLDLTLAGDALAPGERERLSAWFGALGLGFGDRMRIEGEPTPSAEVAAIAARHGLPPADATLRTPSPSEPGKLRVSVQRSRAYVPNCPDWSASSTANLDNTTSPGFGCAVNGNLAAMVADPEHLLAGARAVGGTVVMTGTKAIESYRALEPTGGEGLSNVSSQGAEE